MSLLNIDIRFAEAEANHVADNGTIDGYIVAFWNSCQKR